MMLKIAPNRLSCAVSLLLLMTLMVTPLRADDAKSAKLQVIETHATMLERPAPGDYDVAKVAPTIRWGLLPGQWEGAHLWSSWGDAALGEDGNYYVSIGDHDQPFGNSLVYRINPKTNTADLVVTVNDYLSVEEGKYAPGKIHAPLVDTDDGYLYFGTYRGSPRGTGPETGYVGDSLFRYEYETGKTENLGVFLPHSSWVVTEFHAPTRRLYGLTVPGKTMDPMVKQFFVFDIDSKKVLFKGGPEARVTRAMILSPDGRAWYDTPDGNLVMYDPKANEVKSVGIKLPADGTLRAVSRVSKDGIAYCVTSGGTVFAFNTNDQSIREIGPVFPIGKQYTAAVRLDPTERYLYYVPGAHGGTSQVQTPVVQLDLKTGRHKALAFLNPALRKQHAYNLGGAFGIELSEDGSQLLINFNGAPDGQKRSPDFGLCSVMLIDIPASERTPADAK